MTTLLISQYRARIMIFIKQKYNIEKYYIKNSVNYFCAQHR